MAVTKVSAAGFTFAVWDGVSAYVTILGIEDWDQSNSKTDAETSDIDSQGLEEHIVVRRGKSLTLNGFFLEDEGDGSRDPGQTLVEAVGALTGTTSTENFRITTPGGTTHTFAASADVMGDVAKGGKNDAGRWSVALKISGAVAKA